MILSDDERKLIIEALKAIKGIENMIDNRIGNISYERLLHTMGSLKKILKSMMDSCD